MRRNQKITSPDQIESNPARECEGNILKLNIFLKKMTELEMTCKQILLNSISIILKYFCGLSIHQIFMLFSNFHSIHWSGKGEVYKRESPKLSQSKFEWHFLCSFFSRFSFRMEIRPKIYGQNILRIKNKLYSESCTWRGC